MAAYYNEIDPYAAEWLRNLIKSGLICDGEVDTRSIVDVQPNDIRHFTQCHFFAGIAGWSHALRLAGWSDDREIWTGSCPCQPFSVAGQGKGTDDPRHLWPHFFRLIRGCRPATVMGEQVAGAAGYGWLDGVKSDLESEDYAIEGVDIAACSVNAPHIRQRLYWAAKDMGVANSAGRDKRQSASTSMGHRHSAVAGSSDSSNDMDNAQGERLEGRINDTSIKATEPVSSNAGATGCDSHNMADADLSSSTRQQQLSGKPKYKKETEGAGELCFGRPDIWNDAVWLKGADGKTRRAKPGVRLLAYGVPARVGKLRAYGNAIVPPLAAEVIKAFMEQES